MTTLPWVKVAALVTPFMLAAASPFAGRPLVAADTPVVDPFGGEAAPPDVSTTDPFGAGFPPAAASAVDPFAAESGSVDPFDPAPRAEVRVRSESDADAEGTLSTNATPREAIRYFDAKVRSSSELAIERALRSESRGDFLDDPLEDVLEYFSQRHRIPIAIDRLALQDLNLTADVPVTASLSGISLRSMMKLVLRDLQLTYVIRDEVLLITTPEEAEQLLETRVYVIPQGYSSDPAEVATLLREMTPESWSESGGPGFVGVLGDRLVVQQTQAMHNQIHDLFGQLVRRRDRVG